MSMRLSIGTLCLMVLLVSSGANATSYDIEKGEAVDGQGPIFDMSILLGGHFTLNKGQVPYEEVIFHTPNAYFTASGVIFRVMEQEQEQAPDQRHGFLGQGPTPGQDPDTMDDVPGLSSEFHVYKVEFLGGNNIEPVGRGQLPHSSNFFLGNVSSGWATDVPNYKEIVYKDLYGNIDLVYRTVPEGMKYEFIVHPGGKVEDIRMRYEGAEIGLDRDGDVLVIETQAGTVIDGGLYVYQDTMEGIVPVDAKVLVHGDTVSYDVEYDPEHTLVIDPLIYSTLLGGTSLETGSSIALDISNNAYVTGLGSFGFNVTPGAYCETASGGHDVIIFKMNATGDGLIFSTLVGSAGNDGGMSIALDVSNNVYVTGYTGAAGFPTTSGAYCETFGGGAYDAFILKLNNAGNALVYSTYVGGNSDELARSLALDASNNVYVTGYTYSSDFNVTSGAYCETFNGWNDGFVLKLNSAGTDLVYSTYLGGDNVDEGYSLALDGSNNAYVTGKTGSSDFPVTSGAYSVIHKGSNDVFVSKLNSDGTDLLYSTLVGGTNSDFGTSITLDAALNSYVTGETGSADFPTTAEAYDDEYNGGMADVFVFKLTSTGTDLNYSTFIGGMGEMDKSETGYSIALDDSRNAYVCGLTNATDFPTTLEAYDTTYNGGWYDIFVLKLDPTGSSLIYSTFIGGSYLDSGNSIVLNPSNDTYVTGWTYSSDFPTTPGAFQTEYFGAGFNYDMYLLELRLPREPEAPLDLRGVAGDGHALLNWSPPEDANRSFVRNYTIYKGTENGTLSRFTSIGNLTEYNDTDVVNGETYYYAVAAVNIVGEGNRSNVIDLIPGAMPSAPLDINGTFGDRYIHLTWSPPSDSGGFDITDYMVHRGMSGSELTPYATIGDITDYNDTNVTNGLTYTFAVSALNQVGEGPLSEVLEGVPGTVPTHPINLSVEGGYGFVFLRWEPPEDDGGFNITDFVVYRGDNKDELSSLVEKPAATQTYRDADVENGMTYHYAVSAKNIKGEGAVSEIINATPGKVPTNPLMSAATGDGYIMLTWIPPADNGGFEDLFYRLYKGTSSNGLEPLTNITGLEFNDTVVSNGIEYYYAVSAVNEKGEGPRSSVVSAIPAGTPGPPMDLTTGGGDGYVNLSWLPPTDDGGSIITGYWIHKGEAPGNLSPKVKVTGTGFDDLQVMNGVKYYYSVSAVNRVGEGGASTVKEVIPKGPPGMVLVMNATEGDGNVILSWQAPSFDGGSAIIGYRLYRGTSEENITFIINVSGKTYNDTDLTNGVSYYYKILTVNSVGEGPLSSITSATPGAPPDAPLNLKVKRKDDRAVLTWVPPEDNGGFEVQEYRVYRGTSKKDMVLIGSTEQTGYTDKDIKTGKKYHYKVTAVNERGEGAPSDVRSLAITTGLEGVLWPIIIAVVIAVMVVIAALFMHKRMQKKDKDG